jgi:hypothetical protein
VSAGLVSVLVFNDHPRTNNVTWNDVFPFFDLYARLFPAMNQMVGLDTEQSVREFAAAISYVLSLDKNDPGYMYVLLILFQHVDTCN